MKRTFFKNLFRDIKKSLSRFLSIIIIIAVGVAFYAGVRATSPDMKMSGDLYFSKNNLMDFRLISTLGITDGDVKEISKIKGITEVKGSYSLDAVLEREGRSQVLNVNSLPEKGGINDIRITSGRAPENTGEAIVEDRFLKNSKLKLGDIITLKSGMESKLEEKLKRVEFKIVGTAQSPLYISGQRQLSSVGNGSVRGFVYLIPETFKSKVYTEVYVRTQSSESSNSLLSNEEYSNSVKPIERALKEIGVKRGEIRYAEIIKEGTDKINEAEAELEKGKKEASDKFANAAGELQRGRDKIARSRSELERNEALFNQGIKEGEGKIAEGKSQIEASEAELNSKLQYMEQAGVDSSEAKSQLEGALKELEAKKLELSKAEAKLNGEKQEGIKGFAEGRRKLKSGEAKLDKNAEKLRSEEEKANKKLAEGEAEIRENREKLTDIKRPEWYVLGRSTNVGYETYRQDGDRVGSIGKVFPLIFFLVASLVSLTTMTRMVQDKRVEIGTFKALGYSNGAVVAHYLIYALSASLIGSLIGISIGFRLFPPLIMNAYNSLYTIPYKVAPFNTGIALQASLVAVLFVAASAVLSALGEMREVPASLMRPKPPKAGKRIFLERITFLWKRLGFTRKVTARNIFRYKQRLLMTVIGIAACTALMIMGFGLKEGITGATEGQFQRIYKYDLTGSLTKGVSLNEMKAIKQRAVKATNVKSVLFSYSKNATVKMEGSKTQDAYVVVPEDKIAIKDYINLTMDDKDVKLGDEGVILTDKLSRMLHKKAGDTVEINLEDRVIKARISGITEHYVQHYIYMSPAYYESLTGEKVEWNSFYGLLKNNSEEAQEDTSRNLKEIKNVNSIGFKNNAVIDSSKSMDSVKSVVFVLIASAGVLAFVVIYNLTNINITERRRELATIKLLGFFNKELAAYIYRENIILTLLGSITGIFLGIGLSRLVLRSAETNVIMFMMKINPVYFLYSVLLTMLFSMIVNLAMYNRFDKIDMIESLKSVE